jgi:hypothetical protein
MEHRIEAPHHIADLGNYWVYNENELKRRRIAEGNHGGFIENLMDTTALASTSMASYDPIRDAVQYNTHEALYQNDVDDSSTDPRVTSAIENSIIDIDRSDLSVNYFVQMVDYFLERSADDSQLQSFEDEGSMRAVTTAIDDASPDENEHCFGMIRYDSCLAYRITHQSQLSNLRILSNVSGLSTISGSSLNLHFSPPNSLYYDSQHEIFGSLEERTGRY